MNGGFFTALKLLTADQVRAARDGYLCFGLEEVPQLFDRATMPGIDEDTEFAVDMRYHAISDDRDIMSRVAARLDERPEDFA